MKIKVLQIGNYAVGKTYMLTNSLGNCMLSTSPTVGVEFNCIFRQKNDVDIKIHFWDCAGSERFRPIIRSYYSICDIFLIYFDANNILFIDEINLWLNEISDHVHDKTKILLVGNYKNEINYNLQKEIINYMTINKMDYIFISKYEDFEIIINKIIQTYSDLEKYLNEKYTLETPLLKKKRSKSCINYIFPCL